jgi:4-amino-4-deoxy-L-arabinose transferase-like glycosyltransferase
MKKFLAYLPSLVSKTNIVLLGVLILSAFLRLYKIQDYMTFLGDEGRDVLVAYNILHGHLTLLGPTSSVGGFFLGPIYYYFMAPFLLLFNYNPVGPAVMVALFGIATVWLIFKFCSDLFNRKIAIIAATLYAVSPLIIMYSRSSWNPNPLPFFSLLSLYVLYKALIKNSGKLFFLVGILLGVAMQLHYLTLFLGVVVFAYIILSKVLKNKGEWIKTFLVLIKQNILVFGGFLVGWSPLLAFEFRHNFLDFKNISNFVLHSGNTGTNPNFFYTVYDVFFRLFGRLVFYFPAKEQLKLYSSSVSSLWLGLILLVAVLCVLVLLKNLYKSFKYKKDDFDKYLLLFLWLFLGVLLFGFYKKPIYDYYFAFMFPLPFILIGAFIFQIYEFKKIKNIGKLLAVIILFFVILLNLQGLPFRYPANRQLNQMETIARFVNDRTGGKPFNFALITGGNSDHAYRYFFTVWGNPPLIIQNAQNDPQRKTVTNQLFVVCESLPCQPLGNSLWEIAGFGRADVSGHWKVSVVEIYKLIHHSGK